MIKLFLGSLTPNIVLVDADDPDANTKKRQVCDFNFYSGELAVQRSGNEDAVRLFRLAADDCPKGLPERWMANAELKALGANR